MTVPGAAACWADCVKDFGRLPLADVLAPAIALAEEGVPIHAVAAQLWSDNAHQLLDRWGGLEGNPGAASLLVDGRPPRHGEVLETLSSRRLSERSPQKVLRASTRARSPRRS